MKKSRNLLLLISILSFVLIVNVTPLLASIDGELFKTTQSTPMKQSNSSSSTTIMTMSANEALAFRSYSTNGYNYYMGTKQGTGTVYGYVLDSKVTSDIIPGTIYILNLYSSESETVILQEISYNCALNPYASNYTYKQMHLLKVQDYCDYTGYVHTASGYVHTNFDTGNTSAYYVSLF